MEEELDLFLQLLLKFPLYKESFIEALNKVVNGNSKDFVWNNLKFKNDLYNKVDDYNGLRGSYMMALENPDSVGWNREKLIWERPNIKGFDRNNLYFGLDIKDNKSLRNFLKQTGRDKNPWLTDLEALLFLNEAFEDKENIINNHTSGTKLTNKKRAMLLGLVYQGYGPKIWYPNGPETRRINNALFNGSELEMSDAIYDFYKSRHKERAKNHKKFFEELNNE